MVPLKEDGTLDIERIDRLPIEEYTMEINSFTLKQRDYYFSHLPTNDNHQKTVGVKFHPFDEVIEMGLGVDAEKFLHEMRCKYLR